jgi:hypothetical protein
LYRLGQLSLMLARNLEFLSSIITPCVSFEVMREPSTLTLNKGEKDLLAGLEQEMVLTVCAGSYTITKVQIVLKSCITKHQQLSILCLSIIITTFFFFFFPLIYKDFMLLQYTSLY